MEEDELPTKNTTKKNRQRLYPESRKEEKFWNSSRTDKERSEDVDQN